MNTIITTAEPIIADHKALVDAPEHNYIRRDDAIAPLNTIMTGATSLLSQ